MAGAGVPWEPTPVAGSPALKLATPFPSPFSSRVSLGFSLAAPAQVLLQVFDVDGRLVDTIASGTFQPGTHVCEWKGATGEGRQAAAGVYFVRCSTATGSAVKPVVIIR